MKKIYLSLFGAGLIAIAFVLTTKLVEARLYNPTNLQTINGNLLPDGNLTRNIGSPTLQWANAYLGTLTATVALNTDEPLTVGNGSVSSTINGSSTSTFPYGVTFATTGGNVGIGTESPGSKLTVLGVTALGNGSTTTTITGSSIAFGNGMLSESGGVVLLRNAAGGGNINLSALGANLGFVNVTPSNPYTAVNQKTFGVDSNFFNVFSSGKVGIGTSIASNILTVASSTLTNLIAFSNGSTTSTLAVGNRGTATSTFYSDIWAPYRDLQIGGSAGTGNFWTGDGTATTTIRGSGTSTFASGVQFNSSMAASGLSPAAATEYTVCVSNTTGDISKASGLCTVSAAKYKSNIESLQSGIDALMKFQPVNFILNADGSAHIGLIADVVEQIDPKLGVYQNGELRNYDQAGVLAYIIAGVQDFYDKFIHSIQMLWSWSQNNENRIVELEKQVNDLQLQIQELKK